MLWKEVFTWRARSEPLKEGKFRHRTQKVERTLKDDANAKAALADLPANTKPPIPGGVSAQVRVVVRAWECEDKWMTCVVWACADIVNVLRHSSSLSVNRTSIIIFDMHHVHPGRPLFLPRLHPTNEFDVKYILLLYVVLATQ